MRHKRYIRYFLMTALAFIVALPAYNFYQYAKKYDYKQLVNTDILESYRNYLVYKFLDRSMVQDKVIVGKDGFLFLGNQYNNVLHQTNGIIRASNKEIEQWSDRLKTLQEWYEKRGIKFIVVIAPNKHSIYRDKLPDWMQYEGKNVTDAIVATAYTKKINLLDLREVFAKYKINSAKLLYQKSDTHWNNIAAGIAYDKTIESINKNYGVNLKKNSYEIVDKKYGSGDLSNFLKISALLESNDENIYDYRFNKSMIEFSELRLGNYGVIKMKKTKNRNFFTNQANYIITNKKALNSENLLFVCDSFSSNGPQNVGNSILYNETFQSVLKIYFHMMPQLQEPYLATLLERFNIKTVIYQVVERDVYTKLHLGIFSNIITINELNATQNVIFDLARDSSMKNNQLNIKPYRNILKFTAIEKDPIIILNQTQSQSSNVVLSYEIDSPIDTTFQIYYKEKKTSHYNEKDSYRVAIKKGNNRFNLLIPSRYINNQLRVDLVSSVGSYKIKKFELYALENEH